MILHDRIAEILPAWRIRVNKLVTDYRDFKVCDVTISQIYQGIRGVQTQVSDISYVDPYEGLRLRGYTIPEALEKLPRLPGVEFPMAGGLYYLLMTDSLPNFEEAMEVENEWKKHAEIPTHVINMIRSMPRTTHPMTLFSQAILALQGDSVFSRRYTEGLAKSDYWIATLDDSIQLTAKLPAIAAFIYNWKYRDGVVIPPNPNLDWSGNFAHMIENPNNHEYEDLCRLFFLLHSDHEGANVSAHTAHLVNSALSDIYLTSSAAMNGLAGPLHGLANQECLRWLLKVYNTFDSMPTQEQIADFTRNELASGRVIPGYGHAVLRTTDPRFTAQWEFAKKYMPDDELYQLVCKIYEVLPGILKESGKVKNPYPNVDAINGTMQYHFGVREFDFYTVLFGVSRILGITSHAVWARALNKPIERPKSLTTAMLEDRVAGMPDMIEVEL
ncbi:MAG: citrate (Si)-synthase [Leptolinea sp.]